MTATLADRAPPVRANSTAVRILAAGMRCFAREGYDGATTRMIAADAGVSLPVIAYHFGNKDGLHRACAHDIVEQHRRQLLPLVTEARRAVDANTLDPASARAWLEQIIRALVMALTSGEDQQLATSFVLREMSQPGPGFSLLFDQLWSPGIGLVADLLTVARGRKAGEEGDRAGALMLIAALSAFTREAPLSLAFLDWDGLNAARREVIMATALQLLDGLLRG